MEDLKKILAELLREISFLEAKVDEVIKPLEETSVTLPAASESLQDVITFTERAVNQVVELLEAINENSQVIEKEVEFLLKLSPIPSIESRLINVRERNRDNINKLLQILTLLSFQDLASQQLKKVISTLEELKRGIIKIVVSSVERMEVSREQKERILGKATEMLTGDRISQTDVDALLNELGL
ncbi:putative chemotaxis phosphatase, CheZ [Thermocrinis albus DSM 14484]|uniref:Putative chemotaxis phosphatase, CheZ n=1 Tax=Thermocrinis albus (strain DSM 14484 / JCM 11386 / HI 11/12) TaxID=638303 RepID=D3SPQ4_THEAH|nr:protein phosphatase CheZ [Thermocrinis albus]ADC89141.1 putative chemotaxis phosphatase, CheZ [Thermocrinis albus DSM 14484]